jgi:hypothetical protein
LASERLGKESEAFQGLLAALQRIADDDVYDGRAIADWYGLVGIEPPEERSPELVRTECPKCKRVHFPLEEKGRVWNNGVCASCWPTVSC